MTRAASGQLLKLDIELHNDAGGLADPDTLSLILTAPDGSQTTKTLAGGDITRMSLGEYRYLDATADAGHYTGHWHSTGDPEISLDVEFDVRADAPYVNPDDVRATLAGTATLAGSAAALADDDLLNAIYEAQDEVNARIAGRYTTPMVDVPPLVGNITRDIAAYLATLTYRRGNPIQPGDPVLLRYQRAQTLLGQVANGQIVLSASPPPGQTSGTPTANPYSGSLFGAPNYLRDVPTPDPTPADPLPDYIPAPYGF